MGGIFLAQNRAVEQKVGLVAGMRNMFYSSQFPMRQVQWLAYDRDSVKVS